LSAPLSSTLETACLAFDDLVQNDVNILAIPELQSMGNGQNWTGMNLKQLKELYGDASKDLTKNLGAKLFKVLNFASEMVTKRADKPKPGPKNIEGDADMGTVTPRDFRCSVDFRFMCEIGTTQSKKIWLRVEDTPLL
jgi:hypothetical protein